MEVLCADAQGKYPPVDCELHHVMERNMFSWSKDKDLLFLPMRLISELSGHVFLSIITKFENNFLSMC